MVSKGTRNEGKPPFLVGVFKVETGRRTSEKTKRVVFCGFEHTPRIEVEVTLIRLTEDRAASC